MLPLGFIDSHTHGIYFCPIDQLSIIIYRLGPLTELVPHAT